MENENYVEMFYRDLINYNVKRTKNKIFIDDLSIINNYNPLGIKEIEDLYLSRYKSKNTLLCDLLTSISTSIFMGLDRDYDKWYYLDLLVSCLDVDEGRDELQKLVNVVANDIKTIKKIIQEKMDKYRINGNSVALDKILMGNNSLQILGTFVAFEEGIKYV